MSVMMMMMMMMMFGGAAICSASDQAFPPLNNLLRISATIWPAQHPCDNLASAKLQLERQTQTGWSSSQVYDE